MCCGNVFNKYYYYKEPALHEECFNSNIKAKTTIMGLNKKKTNTTIVRYWSQARYQSS